MGFMQEQILYTRWIVIDGNNGTDAIPFDVVFTSQNEKKLQVSFADIKDYTQYQSKKDIQSIDIVDGYGARLSAPGYMDCTEWAVFKTEEEAKRYLKDVYGEEE